MIIEGDIALWLNFLAVCVISFAVANIAVSALTSILAQRFLQLEIPSRKHTLWLLVTIPWLVSLIIAACFLYPVLEYSPFSPVQNYTHWHHMNTFYMDSWHSVTLMAALTYIAWVGINKLSGLKQHSQQLSTLHQFATPLRDKVFVLENHQASAFSSGFRHPKCYITSGMLDQMNANELEIIIQHELAHIRRRDPFKKWLFSLLVTFFIPVIANRLKLHMVLAMEQAADEAVIEYNHQPIDIASTLIKAARLNASNHNMLDQDLVANFGAEVLEQRVYFLLGQLQLKPLSPFLSLGLFASVICLCALSLDSIHHIIETIFSH